jgi:hypothetical protein
MIRMLKRLFRRRDRDHLCAHARVAEVYRCRCGDTFVKERR